MKFFSSAVLFASVAVLSVSASSKCKVPTHYKEIGCTGVTKEGEECPSSYNCDHLAEAGKSATEECHFRGQVYGDFQGPERDQLPNCVPYAHCHNGNFMAGHIDCGPLPYGDDNCLIIRDGCCPSAVCGKEEMAKVHVCFLDGEKFHKGERKSPKDDPCVECTCDEKFDNSTSVAENKNCKTVDCFSDFWHVKDYKKNCAPVYYGKDRCCASHTKCPSDEDKIVKAKEPAADSSLVCKYGEQELHLGDQVTDRNNCLDCTCLTPPLVECHQRENCERIFN